MIKILIHYTQITAILKFD